MPSSFDFQDVVFAEGEILKREDRKWFLGIGCSAASSFLHGTRTQDVLGRTIPLDVQVGIRDSDDLMTLAAVLLDVQDKIATKLGELTKGPKKA